MQLDFSQIIVAPNAITFPEWVYTSPPIPQSDLRGVVVIGGNSDPTQNVLGTSDNNP